MLADILPELSRYHLVLASGSPRRHELLAQIGVNAEIVPSRFPEDLNKTEFSSAGEYCLENSRRKVLEVLDRKRNSFDGPTIIISSDTVVINDGEILEKPKSPEEALEMLTSLQGRTHCVISSIVLLSLDKNSAEPKIIGEFEKTSVTFDKVSKRALEAYVKTKDPLDKAGSYGIQGPSAIFIKEIQGDYYNVVGFPLNLFYRLIQSIMASN